MPFYKINLNDYPEDVEYRSLSTHPVFGQGKEVIQTKLPLPGLMEMTAEECGPLGDLTHCIAQYEKKAKHNPDPEIDEAVARIVELSFKYPDKVANKLKGKVDMSTTEGLLSADGKPVKLDAPQGWR